MLVATAAGRVGKIDKDEYNGTTALKFSVGCNYYDRKDKEKKTQWVNCTLWGKRGENLPLEKGQYVTVMGELRAIETEKSLFLSMNVSELALGPKSGSSANTASSARPQDRSSVSPQEFSFDDIPF